MSWRLAWAAPTPLVLAIVLATTLSSKNLIYRYLSILALALFCLCGQWTIFPSNGVFFGWLKLKVPSEYYSAERIVSKLQKQHIVLAPESISVWIPTFHQHPRQIISRKGEINFLVSQEEAQKRIFLQGLLEGEPLNREVLNSFIQEIRIRNISAIVIDQRYKESTSIINHLMAAGFKKDSQIDSTYSLYTKEKVL